MLSRSFLGFALLAAWLGAAIPASGSGRAGMTPSYANMSRSAMFLQDQQDVPQSFNSGPWRFTVVDALQSPAIEGVLSSADASNEWVVLVIDLANLSEQPSSLALAEVSLGPTSPSAAEPAQSVAISDVNLRAGPGTDTAIVGVVVEGTAVEIEGDPVNGFYPVSMGGQAGWIFADFLSTAGPGAAVIANSAIDEVASQAAAGILGEELASGLNLQPGEVQRFAAAFPVAVGARDFSLVHGDEFLPLTLQQRAALAPGALPTLSQAPDLIQGELVNVTGSRAIEIRDENGTTSEVELFGIETPIGNECFATEAEAELTKLVSNGIALESVGDHYLVWAPVGANEAPTLVNHALVESGFAAANDPDGESTYGLWLTAAEDQARAANEGLWAACTSVHGNKKPEPTPTPVPTASPAEIRASYPVLPDVRELAIRPGNLMGDRIAFTGEIFNIQVATPGRVFIFEDSGQIEASVAMQIWVIAPDGTREPVYVAFDGDTSGMFVGTFVTVYGTVVGTESGTNLMGGEINQPLVKADIVDFA